MIHNNTILYCQERASWVLKIVENLWAVDGDDLPGAVHDLHVLYTSREKGRERERKKERQTDRQTDRHRWKHYLLGGGKKHQYYVPCGTWCRRLWWWAGGTWRAVPAEVAGSRGRRPGTVCKHRRSRWTPAHLCLSPPQPCRLPPSRHRPLPAPSPTVQSPVNSFIYLYICAFWFVCLSPFFWVSWAVESSPLQFLALA